MLAPDPVGVGDAHQGQRSQSVHVTETGAGPVVPQQKPGLLQLSLHLLSGTAASRGLRGARARQLRGKSKPVCGFWGLPGVFGGLPAAF